ncbi:hypothetical protein Salat_2111800 [Sesamum alatum]|uniref:C2 domain-containing protein n=1 Tax=Sesamum alatum TaxID=300844 RepID=A0AAE1Y168_9LAMI|nr:hypothetical protein Salat_2111800 [Sesamum alatum]
MRTYARAWVNPNRKLLSCTDKDGNNNPTWNDKFVFRVEEEFLREDSSAVMIEIYSAHWLRDVLVGTVRVLVGNLILPPVRTRQGNSHYMGMRFIALQVRRPSGRPQGILNIGVALLDGSMRSMPFYRQLSSSAVGYRDLMQHPPTHLQVQNDNNNKEKQQAPALKPILRRSRSERSERIIFDDYSPRSSMVAVPTQMRTKEGSSILTVAESFDPFKGGKKKGKASSVISGAELLEKPKQKGKKGKAGSVVSDSIVSKESSSFYKNDTRNLKNKITVNGSKDNKADQKLGSPEKAKPNGAPKGSLAIGKPVFGAPYKGNSIVSDSEVGPSPSEVAAALAQRRYLLDDNQSSVLDGWSLDESVEGLRSKLERWRTELPPLYDNGFSTSSYKSSGGQHGRRHSDGGSGLFSCFGNICGYECQCICGKPPGKRNQSRFAASSVGSPGRSIL